MTGKPTFEETVTCYSDLLVVSGAAFTCLAMVCRGKKALKLGSSKDFGNGGKHIATSHAGELAFGDENRWKVTSKRGADDDADDAPVMLLQAVSVPSQTLIPSFAAAIRGLAARFLPAVTSLIIRKGMPFACVESEDLRDFFMAGAGVPQHLKSAVTWSSRRTVTRRVFEQLETDEAAEGAGVRKFLETCDNEGGLRISISADIWRNGLSYVLGIIARYITNDYRIVEHVVFCDEITGAHTADALPKIMEPPIHGFLGDTYAHVLNGLGLDAGMPLDLELDYLRRVTTIICTNHRSSSALGKLFEKGGSSTAAALKVQALYDPITALAKFFRASPQNDDELQAAQKRRGQALIAMAVAQNRALASTARIVSFLTPCDVRWFYEADMMARYYRLAPAVDLCNLSQLFGPGPSEGNRREEFVELVACAKASALKLEPLWVMLEYLHRCNRWFQQRSSPTLGFVLTYVESVHAACRELFIKFGDDGDSPNKDMELIIGQMYADWSGEDSPRDPRLSSYMDAVPSGDGGVFQGWGVDSLLRFAQLLDPRFYANSDVSPRPANATYLDARLGMLWGFETLLPMMQVCDFLLSRPGGVWRASLGPCEHAPHRGCLPFSCCA